MAEARGDKPPRAVVVEPVEVVTAPSLTITEYFGRVANQDRRLSACVAEVTGPCEEAYQTPAFDEYVLVLEGSLELLTDQGVLEVPAGKGIYLERGTRVKWRWPGPCKYVPLCLPAFSPANCGREDTGSATAKDEAAMLALRQLHAATKFPWLFHVARRELWEAAKKTGAVYYPPTYAQDGFTHATADPSKLLDVLNHFYTVISGDWVCLRFSQEDLKRGGVSTVFEPTAPVGDVPAIDMGSELFPHLIGGVPSQGVVTEELPVVRNAAGDFVEIPGLEKYFGSAEDIERSAKDERRRSMRLHMAGSGAAGLVLGAALGALAVCFFRSRKM